eukprot:CAMPEP_0170455898 /NCGR_PEP_ID=MMETSP0123-20130129/3709_1 /TAXON_ID=182087 /ORGANISM="Favella ehrenbergii, Strain Fehren 1" /LENGTH=128 /DNA_ID=CAMNT_0010719189 /DNA_START=751 /DNA_END=1137 /DNA_ORIENTATION=-
MTEVDEEEAQKMKAFLKQMNLQRAKNPSAVTMDSAAPGDDKLNVDMQGVDSQLTMQMGEQQEAGLVDPASKLALTASSPEEKRRIGKVYQKGQPLEDVVASEMTRIRQAFDVRLGEHTEDLVQKVTSG